MMWTSAGLTMSRWCASRSRRWFFLRDQRGATTSAGQFEIKGLKPGKYHLRVDAHAQPTPKKPTEVTVEAASDLEGVRVVMDRGGVVEGVVVEQGGKPIAGVRVSADGDRWTTEDGHTKDDGTFRLEGLQPGKYRVTASVEWRPLRAPGTGDDDRQGVEVAVKAGETVRARVVVERRDGKIRGRVVDAAGEPVTDAFLQAERESEAAEAAAGSAKQAVRWSWSRQPGLTDLDGRFTLEGLSPGKYTVHASRKGGGEAIAEHVAAGASVTLRMVENGRIEGTVVGVDGAPPDVFSLQLQDRTSGYPRHER